MSPLFDSRPNGLFGFWFRIGCLVWRCLCCGCVMCVCFCLLKGRLFLKNRFTISMDYSRTGSIGGSNGVRVGKSEVVFKDDWRCSKCGCDNFQRRLQCFKCGLSKAESEKVRVRESGENRSRSAGSGSPSCTLVIRGLDGLTEEAGVVNALESICGDCRLRNVFIVRNETTGIGEGYGYMEFYSRQEAEDVMETIRFMDCQLEIDGKEVIVDYSRESFATVVASINQSLLNSNLSQNYDYDNRAPSHQYNSYYGETDVQNTPSIQQSNATSGSVQNSTQYARQYQAEPAPVAAMPTTTDTGRQDTSLSSGATLTLSDNEFANYASPDLNRYVFDDLTGYYIDPVTGLYYDAGTQYFYQMETGRFLYWDPDKNCYFPASEQSQETKSEDAAVTKASEETALSKQEEERREKANAAKKIAKEMDKWVKAQNSQKESGFKKPLAPICLPPKASAAADAGFNVIAKSKFTIELPKPKPKEEKKVLPAPTLPGLVAYGGDSDSDTEADDDDVEKAAGRDAERAVEEKLIDWGKLTCLLCRRAFASADMLTKHQQLSDLHKTNLEEYKKKLTGTVTRAPVVSRSLGVTKFTTAKR